MRFRNIVKNSVRFLSDEQAFKIALVRTVNSLGGTYESKIVEDTFYVAAEIFLDLNLPSEERKFEVQTIIDTLEAEVKKAEAELAE